MATTSRRVCAQRKKNRPSRTSSVKCKTYTAIPPAEGWPGGDPVKNGWKPR
jgi:hypothetical protein